MGRSFRSLGEFGTFLASRTVVTPLVLHAGLEAIAKNGAEHARELCGNEERLQPELAASTQEERVRLGFSPDETLLRTGSLRDSIETDAGLSTSGYGTKDKRMPWLEDGTARIPGRHLLKISANDSREENFAIAAAAAAEAAGVDPRSAIVELRMKFPAKSDITARLAELNRRKTR